MLHIKYMTVYLSVCPFICMLVRLCKHYWLDLYEKMRI